MMISIISEVNLPVHMACSRIRPELGTLGMQPLNFKF